MLTARISSSTWLAASRTSTSRSSPRSAGIVITGSVERFDCTPRPCPSRPPPGLRLLHYRPQADGTESDLGRSLRGFLCPRLSHALAEANDPIQLRLPAIRGQSMGRVRGQPAGSRANPCRPDPFGEAPGRAPTGAGGGGTLASVCRLGSGADLPASLATDAASIRQINPCLSA